MSKPTQPNLYLTRRHWLALAASAVSGCGGGSGVSTALLPGTGGTGIYTQGSISGFGSVIVNSIKFDDGLATVQMDGGSATSADLRVGMVASVQGERGAVLTLGTAHQIEVWSIAQGPLLQAATVTQKTQLTDGSVVESAEFTVAGMTVLTNPSTSFSGVAAASALSVNQVVVVWGLQAGADGTHWTATRVAALPMGTMDVVSTGLVKVDSNSQRSLNGMPLSGGDAAALVDKSLVRVRGTMSAGAGAGSMAVAHVKLLGAGLLVPPPAGSPVEVEIEGVVTGGLTASGFMLGNLKVDASALVPLSVQITVGTRLEVYGTWQSGVLNASRVKLEEEQNLNQVEIEAMIEEFTSLGDFVVRGQRCDARGAVISHGTAADLRRGIKVKLKGTKAGNLLLVTELEIDH